MARLLKINKGKERKKEEIGEKKSWKREIEKGGKENIYTMPQIACDTSMTQ